MIQYDTDDSNSSGSDFDELERYILDNISTDEESSVSDEDNNIQDNSVIVSRDGTRWYTEPPPTNRAPIQESPPSGPTPICREVRTVLDAFNLVLPQSLRQQILDFTRSHVGDHYRSDSASRQDLKQSAENISILDINAYLGILLHLSVTGGNNRSVDDLWSRRIGDDFCRCTMSKKEFLAINTFIRFDDRAARHLRNAQRNGPVPFEEQDMLVKLSITHIQQTAPLFYVPGKKICIDEGLVRFKGNCPLKVYEPSKPGSVGIKMYLLCDTETHYTHYIEPYRKGGPPSHFSGQNIVDRLVTGAGIAAGHAVVADRFFTSVALATQLLERGITYTGTCVQGRRFIPSALSRREMRANPNVGEMSTTALFTDNLSLVGYVPQRHYHRNFKVVLILSTHYQSHQHVVGEHRKPEAMMFYNSGKAGVDTKNRAQYYYNAKRISRRWPHAIFCYLLSLLTDNAWVVYTAVSQDPRMNVRVSGRKHFLIDLSEELARPKMMTRQNNVERLLKEVMYEKYNVPRPALPPAARNNTARCHTCSRVTRKRCTRCRAVWLPVNTVQRHTTYAITEHPASPLITFSFKLS